MEIQGINSTVANESNNQSFSNQQDDDILNISSPILIDEDDIPIPLDNLEKIANTVLEQFFNEIRIEEDGTKFAKCLLCHTVVKQSTSSTFNYGRHVQRKHSQEMNKWKVALESKRSIIAKKQPSIRRSFEQSGKLSSIIIE